MAKIGDLFKTGEVNPVSGDFEFSKYVDDKPRPAPTAQERKIPLAKGNTFPPIRSTNAACWWKLVRFE